MAAPVGADNGHPALALRLLMLISSVPNPLTAMMADNGIMAILPISKTRTLTALGAGGRYYPNYRMEQLLSTAELQGLMGQFHQSVESQLGQGTVDAMLQYAGTLDAGTQSTLERMVMSGDPAQMQRAVQYLQERMAGGSITGTSHTASLPRNLSECHMLSLSRRMTSFRSGRSNQGMAPAIASTTNNTALWLRSAPLANALVANAQRWNAPA
jgi:hypothetical protein